MRHNISAAMRDVLIEHMDGRPGDVIRNAAALDGLNAMAARAKMQTTAALIARGYLRTDGRIKPRHTYITDAGRDALCEALSDWADAIHQASTIDFAWFPQMRRIIKDEKNL